MSHQTTLCRPIALRQVGELGLNGVTKAPLGLTDDSSVRMVYVFHLLHRLDIATEQPTHHSRGGAPVPEKTDKTVCQLQKIRTKLIAGVAVSTPTGAFMTVLASEGLVGAAFARAAWSVAEVSWVALIGCLCTLAILAQGGRDMRYQEKRFAEFENRQAKRLEEFERRRDNSMQMFVEETAEQVAERFAEELKLEQLNSEYRKLN